LTKFSDVIEWTVDALGPTTTSIIGYFAILTGNVAAVIAAFRVFQGILNFVIPGIGNKLMNVVNYIKSPFVKFGSWLFEIINKFSGLFKILGVGLTLGTYSGGLNTNEDEELAKRRNMGATIDSQQSSEISVPKTPAPSVINSPSAVKASPESSLVAPEPSTPSVPGKEKSVSGGDVNSTLNSHNSLLASILEVLHNSESTNRDILRYAKNQA
jgi:hypothetical protein